MDWNDIQNSWQARDDDDAGRVSTSPPTSTRTLWRLVKRRDYIESGLALLLMPLFSVFGVLFARNGQWIAVAFLGLIVIGLAIVPWQLWRTRRMMPTPDPEGSVIDFLRDELRAIEAQESQSRWAVLWYFLPIGVGVIGFYTSVNGLTTGSLAYAAIVVLLGVGIDWLNRVWAARKFREAAATLRAQIEQLENP